MPPTTDNLHFGCSYHLHSSHHFLSTWDAVILDLDKERKCVIAHHKICNVLQMMGLPDHVPSLRQTLSPVVIFSACPLLSLQTKQALEPGVVPL